MKFVLAFLLTASFFVCQAQVRTEKVPSSAGDLGNYAGLRIEESIPADFAAAIQTEVLRVAPGLGKPLSNRTFNAISVVVLRTSEGRYRARAERKSEKEVVVAVYEPKAPPA